MEMSAKVQLRVNLCALPANQTGHLQFVVVSTDPENTGLENLARHKVNVDRILSTPAGTATPTLVLVDEKGIVQKTWLGRLTPAAEQEVVTALKAS